MIFSEIEPSDRARIEPFLLADGEIMADRCFATLFLWSEYLGTKYCIEDGFLYLKTEKEGRLLYYMPLGAGELARAFEKIDADAGERAYELRLLTEKGKDALPGYFDVSEDRDLFDYIYATKDLAALTGKKYHGKRNFVSRFKNAYAYEYAAFSPERDGDEALECLSRWADEEDAHIEAGLLRRALQYYDELSLRGGVIRINGRLAAFTVAAEQDDRVTDIIIEHGDREILGVFQAINNFFAQTVTTEYINREDDLGVEGLRTAKLSYHPVFLTVKYAAVKRI